MRIVIDMQGAQGSNRQRGIGRYTLSLTQAIVRHCGMHEIFLALNGLLPDTIESIRAAFDGLLQQQNIRVWEACGPVCSLTAENDWRRRSAELIREAFLASLKPDIVLVSSLFEGPSDDSVTSVGALSRTVPTAVVLYDLIPLIHRDAYLGNPTVETWYENKLGHLRRVDLLLAISESSRQEALHYLNFPAEACFNISTAADLQFRPQQVNSRREQEIRLHYGLQRSFVMYTGGCDYRKNIEGLIRAYAKLPGELRTCHQLAIVCSLQPPIRTELETLARKQGLKDNEVVLTGFVPEQDLVTLYNLCKVFVFPSWHEGFGLPALEAMSCGRAVIGANTSSLPEVIGREDALFDPRSDSAIAEKLGRVLTDDTFRTQLERHGLEQARRFSWDTCGQRAITAIEAWHDRNVSHPSMNVKLSCRPKLAYVSPLPPEHSGISDYSAELLPELSRHYDVDVIVAQDSVSDTWVRANCRICNEAWFRVHADRYDRVLYHFGNSAFHQHMFNLLEEVPGVVVLHDFFLSGIVNYMDATGCSPGFLAYSLYQSHGYTALQQCFHPSGPETIYWRYPCNLGVFQRALGVIVHSENSRRLANQWYGEGAADDWTVIPLMRVPQFYMDRIEARRLLKIDEEDFVVCSFGLLGPLKLNHRLLGAWLASALAKNAKCFLVFVGENHDIAYGADLARKIRQSGHSGQIRITGWTDAATFRHYLAAADVGVQLRTRNRGETSAAILDCMNYGLPTIVNANGSNADLPDEGVWKLPDEFADAELTAVLETMWREPSRRQQLGTRAREIIRARHAPRTCANQYAEAIEAMYRAALTGVSALARALVGIEPSPTEAQTWISLADAIALSIPSRIAPRQLLVDVSELVQRDSKSGIQRVVRNILQELLDHPPEGFRIEPVYATLQQGYRYARKFTLQFLDCPETVLTDDPIDYKAGDLLLGLDLQPHVVPVQHCFYQQLRNHGVIVKFVVYDLLPILLPAAFPVGAAEVHQKWLQVVAENDGVICISKAVAEELADWVKTNVFSRQRSFTIDWFHLGADNDMSRFSQGMPVDAGSVLNKLAKRPSFLMVGTLEPRKGHAQVLAAFEKLWLEDVDANLILVGKQGWMTEALADRIRKHSEWGKRLFWLEGISDEYLEKVYAACNCLIFASEGEGFGLPLIEAARHKVPIIARDIPVFREVAGEHAFYFRGLDSPTLAHVIRDWLSLNAKGLAPQSFGMPWLTWRQSTEQLMNRILLAGKKQTFHNTQ